MLCNPSAGTLSEFLVREVGTQGMFIFFTGVTFIGLIYFIICFRDTTYKEEIIMRDGKEIKNKVRLTDNEKQHIYMPDEYKNNSIT